MIDGCFDRSSCRKLSWGWAASTWSRWFPTLPPLSVRNWERVIASWLLTASAWSVWSTTCKYTEYCTQYTVWSLPVSVCSHLSVFSSQRQRTDPIIGRLAQTSGGQDRLKAEWEELGCDQMLKDELRWTIKCNWEYGTDGHVSISPPTKGKLSASPFFCTELRDNQTRQQDWLCGQSSFLLSQLLPRL